MAYNLMKRIIERGMKDGTLDKQSVMDKLDAFFAVGRMNREQYEELMGMMNPDETKEGE